MVQLLAALACFAAPVAALFSVLWAWIIMAAQSVLLTLILCSAKRQVTWDCIPELSPIANEMLRKYPHYYAMPTAGRDFSSWASTLMFAGAAVALIGLFHHFWWGLAFGIVNWFAMGCVAAGLNPTNYVADSAEGTAHNEIMAYLKQQRRQSAQEDEQ